MSNIGLLPLKGFHNHNTNGYDISGMTTLPQRYYIGVCWSVKLQIESYLPEYDFPSANEILPYKNTRQNLLPKHDFPSASKRNRSLTHDSISYLSMTFHLLPNEILPYKNTCHNFQLDYTCVHNHRCHSYTDDWMHMKQLLKKKRTAFNRYSHWHLSRNKIKLND